MKIKIRSIVIVLTCLLILNIPYISQRSNNIIKLVLEMILLVFCLNKNFNKKVFKANIAVSLFSIIILLCTFINFGIETRTLNALVTGLQYSLIFYIIIYMCDRYSMQDTINVIWKYITFIVILVDAVIVITGGAGVGMMDANAVLKIYLIGNKFSVSYYHMLLLGLFLAQNTFIKNERIKKKVFVLLILFAILICRIIECNTGVVGCLIMAISYFLGVKRSIVFEILSNPIVFLSIFIGTTFLLIGTDVLLNNDYIYSIFLKYSHTNKLLSGRLDMYAVALSAFQKSPWYGYGINCTIVEDTLTWGNAQNGLLKMMLDYGIIGTISFLSVCWSSLSNKKLVNKYRSDNKLEYAMLPFLYGMIVCSMVEVNLSGIFFIGLAIIKAEKYKHKNNVNE